MRPVPARVCVVTQTNARSETLRTLLRAGGDLWGSAGTGRLNFREVQSGRAARLRRAIRNQESGDGGESVDAVIEEMANASLNGDGHGPNSNSSGGQ